MLGRYLLCSALMLAVAGGCQKSPGLPSLHDGKHDRIQAVATVGMVADIVRNVGGDRVEVTQLMGSGVDPHLYKTTRDDVQTIMRGDIVFYSGLMLEGKMADTLVKISRTKPVFAVTELIDESYLLEPAEMRGHYDPHVWMDVAAWSKCAATVADALAKYDPPHAAEYRANAAGLSGAAQDAGRIRQAGRGHGAGRLAACWSLRTTRSTTSAARTAWTCRACRGFPPNPRPACSGSTSWSTCWWPRKVKAVFVETSVSHKNIEAIVSGARSRGHQVTIGGELFSDAMGREGSYEGTYEGMMDHNITVVVRALGGDAPAKGLNGKLAEQPKP